MATRAPRICVCGRVVAAGAVCPCQRARKAQHDRGRKNSNARGYGSKWRAESAAFLAAHPVCVRCGAPSTVVNHKTPHRMSAARTAPELSAAQKLFWRRSNWEAVCKPCHDGPIQSEERNQS